MLNIQIKVIFVLENCAITQISFLHPYFCENKEFKDLFFIYKIMSDVTQILIEFKNSLISFFDELIDQFPQEGDLIMVRIFLKDQISIEDVMNIFIHNLNKDDQTLKNMVKERNEIFFLENNVFDTFGKNKVLHFKKLWRSGNLDEDDKLVVWKWIDSFMYLSERYSKAKSQ
jgi:hypothetical protein